MANLKPYYDHAGITIYEGHILTVLESMEPESVQMCVTSPPYWGLRDYGLEPQVWDAVDGCEHVWGDEYTARQSGGGWAKDGFVGYNKNCPKKDFDLGERSQGQFCQLCGAWRGSLGLEPIPELYIDHLVQIFRKVKRVLRKDGTLFLNLGDSYMGSGGPGSQYDTKATGGYKEGFKKYKNPNRKPINGLKPKDLCMIPARVALALQADGWWLRSAMPWVKRSAMPESQSDRPTSTLDYMFLLTKSAKYYFDMEAVKKKAQDWGTRDRTNLRGGTTDPKLKHHGLTNSNCAESGRNFRNTDLFFESIKEPHGMIFCGDEMVGIDVNPKGYKEAHFATFPPKLIEPCIKAGSGVGDVVLDPFGGSMTTAYVSKELGRKAVMIDLSKEYIEMGIDRLKQDVLPFN